MHCKWGRRDDIEPCEECQSGDDQGEWPGDIVVKRAEDEVDEETTPNPLYSRAPATIRLSYKPMSICKDSVQSSVEYRYPAFPASATKQWDGANNRKYEQHFSVLGQCICRLCRLVNWETGHSRRTSCW
jgi:hypothetical protein